MAEPSQIGPFFFSFTKRQSQEAEWIPKSVIPRNPHQGT